MALRLSQLNIELGSGKLDPARGIFVPFAYVDVDVPVFPGITFQFDSNRINEVWGKYDALIFSLTKKSTDIASNITSLHNIELFILNDVIIWPFIAAQSRHPKVWPAGGAGPCKTRQASKC